MASTLTRVFVDTNVLFSAIHSPTGPPAWVVRQHALGLLRIVVSQRVLDEFVRTVEAKAPSSLLLVRCLLEDTPPEVVRDPTAQEVSLATGRVNAGDAPIWASVLLAQPDYFVTGDIPFLREARQSGTTIIAMTPRELLAELQADS